MAWKDVKKDLMSAWRNAWRTIIEHPRTERWRTRHPKLAAFVRRRFATEDFTGLPLTLVAAAVLYIGSVFLNIAMQYLAHDPLIAVDVRIANLLYSLRSTRMLNVFYFITVFAEAGTAIAVAVALSALLWIKRQRAYVILLWTALVVAEGATFTLKFLFQRPRPDVLLRAVTEGSFSFPSGHATTVVALYGAIAYLAVRRSRSWSARIVTILALAVAVALVDFSRLYLGVHYLSDVLAGNLVGLAGLLVGVGLTEWLIARGRVPRPARASGKETALMFAIALLVVAPFFLSTAPLAAPHREATPLKNIGATDPLTLFGVGPLPRYSETLNGGRQEPTNIIMLVPNGCLEGEMKSAGWILAEGLSLGSTERVAKAALLNKEYPTAPMTPSFYDSYPHDYGFEKETDRRTVRSRHHARFWRTGYATDAGELIVGTASLDTGIKWGITHAIAPDIDTERDLFVNDLKNAGVTADVRYVPFVPPVLGTNFAGDQFFTNGQAAVVTLTTCN